MRGVRAWTAALRIVDGSMLMDLESKSVMLRGWSNSFPAAHALNFCQSQELRREQKSFVAPHRFASHHQLRNTTIQGRGTFTHSFKRTHTRGGHHHQIASGSKELHHDLQHVHL